VPRDAFVVSLLTEVINDRRVTTPDVAGGDELRDRTASIPARNRGLTPWDRPNGRLISSCAVTPTSDGARLREEQLTAVNL
jgi:hypothetical protein